MIRMIRTIFRIKNAVVAGFFGGLSFVAHHSDASDFSQCRQAFAGGVAPQFQVELAKARAICFDSFAVLHSGVSKTPIYSAEVLTRAKLLDARDEERTNEFYPEARLPAAERADLDDYKGTGFDRGHMAPAADMPNAAAMAQSFSLANMIPQAPVNNRKVWSKIEKDTRKYAMRAQGPVYVITGPVFSEDAKRICGHRTFCRDGVMVPSHIYKLVYDASNGRAWAYWVENSDDASVGRPISYADLKARISAELLPGVKVTN